MISIFLSLESRGGRFGDTFDVWLGYSFTSLYYMVRASVIHVLLLQFAQKSRVISEVIKTNKLLMEYQSGYSNWLEVTYSSVYIWPQKEFCFAVNSTSTVNCGLHWWKVIESDVRICIDFGVFGKFCFSHQFQFSASSFHPSKASPAQLTPNFTNSKLPREIRILHCLGIMSTRPTP